MTLDPGTHLGPYEIRSALGAGGMSEVYLALDTRLDRRVAIKVLRAHLADDPQRRARFEREARLISQLNHPHICTLYDVGHDTGTEYIVVEYLEGQTLAERLRKGPLPLAQALEMAIQVASALDAAHRKGIVHRDLKPANVMQTKSGAKLLDFGIARMTMATPAVAGQTDEPTLTAESSLLGTLHYMSPEQLEGRDADSRSDLLAAGHPGHLYPQVLADGAHVLYYVQGVQDVRGVYVSRLDGTSPKRLLAKSSPAVYLTTGYLLFVREHALLAQALDPSRLELKGDAVVIAERLAVGPANAPAASASNNGDIVYRGVQTGSARQLTWLDRSGKTVRSIGSPDSARRW